MSTFITIVFWLEVIRVLVKLCQLSADDAEYPRVVSWTRSEDAFSMLIGGLIAIYCAYLLWWPQ